MAHEVIFGKHPVREALKAKRNVQKIWLSDYAQKDDRDITDIASSQGITVQKVPKKKLDHMAGGVNHQGVAADVAAHDFVSVDDLFAQAAARDEAPFFVLLDEISDPHNLGSIMRTADAAGAHGIIIPKRRSVGLTQTVAKTSAGAIEYVPVARVTNLAQTIEDLKTKGLWFAAADADGDEHYRDGDLSGAIGLVVGSEGSGISRLVKEKCDFILQLPMHGQVSSLNASVAAGLLMYEVERQRHTGQVSL